MNELVRYAVVGLILNAVGYLIYLTFTSLGLSPILTISIFYPLSVIVGYFLHQRHTFRHEVQGLKGVTMVRYLAVYVVGYLLNALLLEILHDHLGYPHQLVQFFAIFVVAGFLFVAMKLIVFNKVKAIV